MKRLWCRRPGLDAGDDTADPAPAAGGVMEFLEAADLAGGRIGLEPGRGARLQGCVPLGHHQPGVSQLADGGLGHRISLRHHRSLPRVFDALAGPAHAGRQLLRCLPLVVVKLARKDLVSPVRDGAGHPA